MLPVSLLTSQALPSYAALPAYPRLLQENRRHLPRRRLRSRLPHGHVAYLLLASDVAPEHTHGSGHL